MKTRKEVSYNGETISYEIIKSKIKNMYIYVREGKVTIKAPIGLKEKEIAEFVSKKSKWIYDKLKQYREHTKVEEILPEDIKRLERIVKNSINKYEKLIGKKPNKVRIKDMKYAWGSCSSNGNISINIKLAPKDDKVIEYVVLHEMSHLKYMNHSKQFWDLVGSYMPNYKDYRKRLK